MKTCNRCEIDKPLSEFYNDKTGKDGVLSICKVCVANKSKETYKSNKKKIIKISNEWLKNNPERAKEIRKISREKLENRKRTSEYNKKRRIDNPHIDKIYRETHKNERNKRDKERRLSDPLYDFSHKITVMIGKSFKNLGYKKDNRKTEDILCCTIEEFKQYLENQFLSWMTWDNYGKYNGTLNYGWDKDHIVPVSSAKTLDDIIKLNHYTNFKPLCSRINRDFKKNKLDYSQ